MKGKTHEELQMNPGCVNVGRTVRAGHRSLKESYGEVNSKYDYSCR
jgi:hypothetical protein